MDRDGCMRENDRSCAVTGNARRLAASVTGLSKLRTLSTCAVLALAPGAAPANWSGTNGLYSVQQTPDDIVVKTSGRIVFSARNFAAAQYAKLLVEFEVPAAPSSTSPLLHVRHAFHLVSLTGSLLALRDEADIDVSDNAIPAGRTRFWTIDLRKGAHYGFGDDPLGPSPKSPGAFVNLHSLFPERTIAAAVAKTDLGRQAGSKVGSGLPEVMYDLAALGRNSPNCYLTTLDTAWSFAIGKTRPSSTSVDLGLQGQPNCRTHLTLLHLTLPRSRIVSGPQLIPHAGLPGTIVDLGLPTKP